MTNHPRALERLDQLVRTHLEQASQLAGQCNLWNDTILLDALSSFDTVAGHPSPLRDPHVFPRMPQHQRAAMVNELLFTGVLLLASHSHKTPFEVWASQAQMPLSSGDGCPMYKCGFENLEPLCQMWRHLAETRLALGAHRTRLKDLLCDELYHPGGPTTSFEGISVSCLASRSIRRYEELKRLAPFPYRVEGPGKGSLQKLCEYYKPIAGRHGGTVTLLNVLTVAFALYLLALRHREQHQGQSLTVMGTDAVVANLIAFSASSPRATPEEILLGIETRTPLALRAYQAVSRLLGMSNVRPPLAEDMLSLLELSFTDPAEYPHPLAALTNLPVMVRATADGCVFFDTLGWLLPSTLVQKLYDQGPLANLHGNLFRSYIESQVLKSRQIRPFRVSRVRSEGKVIGDVDIAFVRNGTLCVIECKDVAPEPVAVLDQRQAVLRSIVHERKGYVGWWKRTRATASYFAERKNLAKLAADNGFDAGAVARVLPLVVTNRPVFVYTAEDLAVTHHIPAVMCRLELEALLDNEWTSIIPSTMVSVHD